MTKVLKKWMAAVLVLCLLVPMMTAMAADAVCYLTISITDSKKGLVVADSSSRYITGESPLAAEVVALIEKNLDALAVFRSPGMKQILEEGLAAYADPDAQKWTDYLNQYFKDVNSDLKTLLTDKNVKAGALEVRMHYSVEFLNTIRGDRTYGTTYTVTVSRYMDGTFDADPAVNGLSELLVTDEHIAYMQGDNNGNFRPGDQISRAEAAQMFYNLLKNKEIAVAAPFSDVAANAWYAPAVNTMAALGILQGDGKGSFRPNDPITRAEFVTVAARFAKAVEGKASFTDLAAASWAENEIATAVGYGWIEGYGDNTFKPAAPITRAEGATVISRMLQRQPDAAYIVANAASLKLFSDVAKEKWYYYTVAEAVNGHTYHYTTAGKEVWNGLK